MGRKKKVVLDEFHYHEALDRSYVVAEILENTLIEHIVIQENKQLKEQLEKAQELIIEVYQEIGSMQIRLFTDPSELPEHVGDGKK